MSNKYLSPLGRERANCVSSYGLRCLFNLLWGMTSQLLFYCVHISLSTCYDRPTNQLLLLAVFAVCINQLFVSCCQRSSVSSEKYQLSRQKRTPSLRQAGTVLRYDICAGGSARLTLAGDSSWFSSIYTNISRSAITACFRTINMSKNTKFYSSVVCRFTSSAAQYVPILS